MQACCPRCTTAAAEVPLSPGAGVLGEAVCTRCGGRLLDEAAAHRVIIEEHGIARETLRELAGHFGRPSLRCPGCAQRMHPVRLRAMPLDLCTGCGAVWLDAGELSQLSDGRWHEVAGPATSDEPAEQPPEQPREDPAAGLDGQPLDSPRAPNPSAAPANSFAVLLDDDVADPARLVSAFARARFRTAQDARTAAQRGHGLVAERLFEPEAKNLAAALTAEGVAARVAEASLLELPAAVRTKELAIDERGVALADSLGRPLTLAWSQLRAAAVGMVRVAETTTKLVAPERNEASSRMNRRGSTVPPPQSLRTSIVERDDVLLDLLCDDGDGVLVRYRATRDGMVFRNRAGQTRDAGFRAQARELLLRLSPQVALSRGARALRDEDAAWLRYRAVRDFEASLRWVWARTRPAS